MSLSLVIFEREPDTVEIIKGYLSEKTDIVINEVFDDYNKGVRYVKENSPKIVVFSMTPDKSTCYKMIHRMCEFGANVIVLSEDYTTSNIIQALRHGAKDFVSKPVIKKDFLEAADKCSQADVKVMKKSQIVAVYSNKGGVGKTAIAANLAVELTKLTRDKVALVDLNMPIGDVTTFLDVKPSIDIAEIVNNANPENTDFIREACCKYKDTELYVLAEPPYIEQSRTITPKQVLKLFECLRNAFSYIVVDMGTNVDKLNMSILEYSDFIMLVTVINLPLIRNCQRCLDLFGGLGFPESKTKIVVNRYLENDEITVDDVEKAIKKQVYWKIPNNYYTMMSSINKGIPVSEVNENSNITESFTQLASKITEDMFEQDLKG